MNNKRDFTDNELIARYQAGDLSGMEVLVNRYKKEVYSYIMNLVKDRVLADDIFQDTFIKAIQTLKSGEYKEKGKFLQWINRIAHNLSIDYYRKEKRLGITDSIDTENISEFSDYFVISTEDKIINAQREQQLHKILDMLPEEQKEVIKLRHFCNLSFKDIATLTDVSINTALGRMRYALINMRKIIEEQKVSFSE